jgi:predicted ATPase
LFLLSRKGAVQNSTFVTRVVLENYKSIAACDVRLKPLTFLVGPNGAGKSNFLDALRLIADGLRTSLDHALRDRGGSNEVRRRSGRHAARFGVRVDLAIPPDGTGFYAFRVVAGSNGAYKVGWEECCVDDGDGGKHFFRVIDGQVNEASVAVAPAATADRLYLVNASGLPEFRPVYELLSRMGFYNLNPDRIRALQPPDPGDVLARDGSNLASVLAELSRRSRPAKQRIEEYLASVVPGVLGVDTKSMGPMETIEFKQRVEGLKKPWRFLATNMSDGTLRALGLLVAVFQSSDAASYRVPLVGIEEPESALHPAAAGILRDCLREASAQTQILVTSHSPELLDDAQIDVDSVLAVRAEDGVTTIGAVDDASRGVLRKQLFTVGELLRLDQLAPDPSSATKQVRLFDEGGS